MSRATLVLTSDVIRARALAWVSKAPPETRIEFKAPKRTIPQNARLWAMLTDIASQLTWHGVRLTADDWKLVFLDALKAELRLVPNIHGTGFVNLGRSSSDLSKAEFGDLMEIIEAFGAEHGVVFHSSALEQEGMRA
ncbi:NinB family protein [Siculibacillus lacustris]|uniref:NinB family protein n=1 Tax=Siculibacillus lacustris TaxID=1549641 RepID=A0A4Q9VFB7_9HYPH|nr:recombination protein NinB [Siculibacillus lacustris]TBW33585.1 NinB family protein [Siculibacillus lacustris]